LRGIVGKQEVISATAVRIVSKRLKNGIMGKFNPATCPERQLTENETFQAHKT
jgi:hypothetical protein